MNPSIEPVLQPYFPFEKDLWTRREGVELTLHHFERFLDRPVVPRGPAGSPDEHRAVLTNVIRHEGRFIMWYTAMRPLTRDPQSAARVTSHCIALSDDGISWEKPDLRRTGRSAAAFPNNVIPDLSRDAYNLGVMRDGDRFVATRSFPQKNRDETTFTIVTSRDGLHWKGTRKPSIRAAHFEAACSLFKFKGKYWVLGQGLSPYFTMPDGAPCGRVMFAYGSTDLRTWKRSRDVAYAYPIPRHFPEAGVQNHAGASPVNRGRIALGMMGQFWPAGFSELVRSTFGLVYSYDGTHWVEPFFAEPLLLPDEAGWDRGMLLQGSGLYSRGGTSYYWYSGLDGGNLWWPGGAAGCVRIRRDGFASFSSANLESSILETLPIRFVKGHRNIYLNVEVPRDSQLVLELLHPRTKRALASRRVVRSGVMLPVLEAPADHTEALLRFRLRGRSRLYTFYIGEDVNTDTYLNEWRGPDGDEPG